MIPEPGAHRSARLAAVLAALLGASCGGGQGPTAPTAMVPTPAPPAPEFSLTGTWTGTIAYGGPAPTSDPASVSFEQQGHVVEAAIVARRFVGRFHGTLAGNRLDGSVTTMIDRVPFGATASGTATPTAIHLVANPLRFQNLVISGGQTFDLTR